MREYTVARYGKSNPTVQDAWILLSNSIYNCPDANTQQGTHESVFCARPTEHPYQVSSWSEMKDYYDLNNVIRAAAMMVSVADEFKGNNNFEYDLVDIVRQRSPRKDVLRRRLLRPLLPLATKSCIRMLPTVSCV